MEKIKNFFKKYVFPASFIFTLFTFVMLIFSSDENSAALKISAAAFVYFVYVMLCSNILKTSIQTFFRILLHYCATALPLILFLIYLSKKQSSGESSFSSSTIVVLMVVFTIVYAIAVLITSMASKKKEEKESDNSDDYKRQFGKM